MPIICLGLNHKTAPVNIRERFSLIESQLPASLVALRDQPGVDEVLILSTCNRTEIYISTENMLFCQESLYKYLFLIHKITAKQIEKYFYFLTDKNAVQHLFYVSCGLDSMILGEGQILGQIKQAFKHAKHYNSIKDILNKLFLYAIKAGKRARSETKICFGAGSISSAVVDLIKKHFRNLSGLKILVIGTGKMGLQAIKYLRKDTDAEIYLTNRSHEKAIKLAQDIKGVAVKFENLTQAIKIADIIISATSSPHFVITRDKLKQADISRPLFIVDIAIPRDVDPDVKNIKNITLLNIDDLGKIVDQTFNMRSIETEKVKNIADEEVSAFMQVLNIKQAAPVIFNIQKKCDDVLDNLIQQIPEIEKEKFRKFGNKLIGKLLHQPIMKIKKLSAPEKFKENLDFLKQIFT